MTEQRGNMHVQVNLSQLTPHKIELRDDQVRIHPNLSVEEWSKYANLYMTHCNDDFTNERFTKYLREPSSTEVVRTIRRFRAGRGTGYTVEWARSVREALNLDPTGFEHIAAFANQHFRIWWNLAREWVFSPDLISMEIPNSLDKNKPTMIGIGGNIEARHFSVTPLEKFNGYVWFCGLVKAEPTTS